MRLTVYLEGLLPPAKSNRYRVARGRLYRDNSVVAFEEQLILATRRAIQEQGWACLEEPAALRIFLWFPDRRRRDLDNALKSILDALTKGGAYHDDSQVAELHVYRLYGGEPAVTIFLTPQAAEAA